MQAFSSVQAENTLRQATALTDELPEVGARSPLHGIPITVKDNIDVAGMRTTAGSRLCHRSAPARSSAAVVDTLLAR